MNSDSLTPEPTHTNHYAKLPSFPLTIGKGGGEQITKQYYGMLPIRIQKNAQEKKKKKTRRIHVKMMGGFCFLHFFYKLHISYSEHEFYHKKKSNKCY